MNAAKEGGGGKPDPQDGTFFIPRSFVVNMTIPKASQLNF
jgi:hypothetical protein